MLFSNANIATFINDNFEPVWLSLRPVPVVTIDFKNGHVIKRTLQGNVATMICSPDAQVLDVLPGIYSAEGYLMQLSRLRDRLRDFLRTDTDRSAFLNAYYRNQSTMREQSLSQSTSETTNRGGIFAFGRGLLEALTGTIRASKPVDRPAFDASLRAMSKAATQAPLKSAINPSYARPSYESETPPASVPNLSPQETSQWEALMRDTMTNEFLRREKIYAKLRTRQTPEALTKWLYREILDADLDDPYLGLGKQLFDTYPFEH